MKAKLVLRLSLRWISVTLILLMGALSAIGSSGGSNTGAAPQQQDSSSNWDEMVWDEDKWS